MGPGLKSPWGHFRYIKGVFPFPRLARLPFLQEKMSLISQGILPVTASIATFFLSIAVFFHLANILYIPAAIAFYLSEWWPGDLNSLWGLLLCIWISHSTSLLFVETDHLYQDGEYLARLSKLAPHIHPKYHKVIKLWNNPRLLGTPYECILKAPKPGIPSGLRAFTVMRLAKLMAYVGLYFYIKTYIFPAVFMPVGMHEFDPMHQVYFRRLLNPLLFQAQHGYGYRYRYKDEAVAVTPRETLLRTAFVAWWTFSAVAMLDAAHAALSLLAVSILGFDTPAEWPPIFGPLSQAWSMRRFWGRFWHQIIRRTYTNYGELLSRRVLRLREKSVPDRLVVIFVVFLLSGVSHGVVSWRLGDCAWRGDVWWFCANFGVGMVEVFALGVVDVGFKRLGMENRVKRVQASVFGRAIGYLWVFGFMFWSVPKWQYPKVYCALEALQ